MPAEVSLIGFLVGLLLGLTSLGGGSLLTPILILLLRVDPLVAVGTDLAYQTVTRIVGLPVHLRQRSVDGRVLALLAAGSIPGTLLARLGVRWLHLGIGRDRLVLTALGVALVLAAAAIVLDPLLRRLRPAVPPATARSRARWALTAAGGLLVGFSVGLTSVGAGSFVMALLVLVHPSLAGRRLVGTDFAHGVVLLPISAALAASSGHVDPGLVGLLLVGSIPGVLIGSRASALIPERPLRLSVAGLLLLTGLRLLPVGV